MNSRTYKIVVAAMLSAVAFVLMLIEVSVPFIIPFFIKLDISDLPALLGAFSLGPVYGAIISLLKNILHIVIRQTETGYVGEFSNFLLGAAFSVPAGLIYQRHKTKKGAIAGAVIGSVIMGVLCIPVNYFITYPMYANIMVPMETIIGLYQAILPSADSLLKCLLIFNLPFTIVKGLLCSLICIMVYKPLSPILHGKR